MLYCPSKASNNRFKICQPAYARLHITAHIFMYHKRTAIYIALGHI